MVTQKIPPKKRKARPAEKPMTLTEIFDDFIRKVPAEELAKHPPDGASNHDHYLYGAPKRKD